jgi:serine/threonine protein kinase
MGEQVPCDRARLPIVVTAPDIPGHSGLAAAHLAGVLHRDIKPANILVNRYGIVGLSDFGLASIIAAGGEAAFDSGTRTFRCVANVVGTQPATSQFRR